MGFSLVSLVSILISPLVLHPSHKLAYFAQAGWPEEWRATAEEIVRTEFERAYANIEISDANEVSVRYCLRLFTLLF